MYSIRIHSIRNIIMPFIDFDSSQRNYSTYPNPAYYIIENEQMRSWQSFNMNHDLKTVKLHTLTIPYTREAGFIENGNVVPVHTKDIKRIYCNISNLNHNDLHSVFTINNKIPQAKFVCTLENTLENSGKKAKFRTFKCLNEQQMRFSSREPIVFELFQQDGKRIWIKDDPPNPSQQTWGLLEF